MPYRAADVFDTISQSFTRSIESDKSAINLQRTDTLGSRVALYFGRRGVVLLDPSNGSVEEKTMNFLRAEGLVSNSTHMFAITSNEQMHLHQVDLETLTMSDSPTFSMVNPGTLSRRYLMGNQFVGILSSMTLVYTLGNPKPIIIETIGSFAAIHDSTLYLVQSASIITYHSERGTVKYTMPQDLFFPIYSTIAHNGILYFSGSQRHIATIQLDGLLQYSTGGPFNFGGRDVGFSFVGPHVSWINLRTQRMQDEPSISLPPNSLAIELQNYWVFNSGHVFEISTETWMSTGIENPFITLGQRGISNFRGDTAIFYTKLFDNNHVNFMTWHATDKTWRFYQSTNFNFLQVYSLQEKLILLDYGFIEVIDMVTNTSTLFSTLVQTRHTVTEELLIMAGGGDAITGGTTDTVFIYNARTNSVTYGRLSMIGSLAPIAQSKTHVLFLFVASTRIDVYSLVDATWSYIDVPPHFSNDRAQIWLSDLQHVVLQRPQRIDIYDMSTKHWRVLAGPPIDGLTRITIQGSKILFHFSHTALIYEITTGDWLRIEGDLLTNFQFTDSFFICQRGNSTIYRPLAMMTNPMESVSNYEQHSTEFDAGLAGSLTKSHIDWRNDGVALNVSSSRLTLENLRQSSSGEYAITVTDQCNQRMMQSATLTVIPRPIFTRPLEDSINLCHNIVVIETEINGETSLEWKINGVTQVTTNSNITIQPERLECNVKHQLCLTATNPSGSNQTCAELRLLEHDAVFDGPRPTVDRSTWFLESQASLQVALLDEDCTRHWWIVDGVMLDPIESQQSTLSVNVTALSSYTQYAIRAQCGSSKVQSNAFTFSNVSTLKEWHLALIIPLVFVTIVGAVVTVVLFRRRLQAGEVHEMELQNLLTQAKTESLTRDGVSVIPSTTWEWAPTDEFTYRPLDSLPCSIDATNLIQTFKNDTVKVDTWNQAEIEITLKSKGGKIDGTLKERLIDGVQIDIYAPQSPKYEVKVEPSSFTLKHGKSIRVTVSTMMRMTAKCKICLVVVIEQQHLYAILEYKMASAMSTWIDLEEVEMTGDFLGGGGFGTVTRGVYRGEEVAVKKLLNQFMDEDLKQEFEREITLMKDLRHPNIVQFVGASNVKDNLAILIEYAPFGSLSSVLSKSKLPYLMKLTILLETAKALQFLHLNRVIHRDIKPQNILVFSLEPKSSVHIKLTDFGTSRFISDTTMTVTKNVGTTLYMAPEALGKNPRIDKSADIYSFAILMWELLYERQPFAEYDWQSDVENHVKNGGRLPLDNNSLNPEFTKLVEDCWKHDPSTRPSASEVVQRLSELI
jgi:hypothetical protein